MVGFNYVIEMVPDKKYGALDPETGEWNGVVRQILEKVKQNSISVESSV
jgi:ionotropic kainate glutamate receptor 2